MRKKYTIAISALESVNLAVFNCTSNLNWNSTTGLILISLTQLYTKRSIGKIALQNYKWFYAFVQKIYNWKILMCLKQICNSNSTRYYHWNNTFVKFQCILKNCTPNAQLKQNTCNFQRTTIELKIYNWKINIGNSNEPTNKI